MQDVQKLEGPHGQRRKVDVNNKMTKTTWGLSQAVDIFNEAVHASAISV
jgi:hypothetical protein